MNIRTRKILAAAVSAPLIGAGVIATAACGPPKPVHCNANVINNPFEHSSDVGFNCGGAVVSIFATLNTIPGDIVSGSWTGVAGGNGTAIHLQHYCRWDFARAHYQFTVASAYQGTKLVGYYSGPSFNVGACG